MRDRTLGHKWATYLAEARTRAGLTKAELALAAEVGRATVFRWEAGESRPEQAELVARVADVLGVDRDEALTAAGLRPDPAAPARPRRQDVAYNPDAMTIMRKIADPGTSPAHRAYLKDVLRREARRIEEEEEAERRFREGDQRAAG